MSRHYIFDINDGKILIQSEEATEEARALIDEGWNIITNPFLNNDEWTLAFNVFACEMAREIIQAFPQSPTKLIALFESNLGSEDSLVCELHRFPDQTSKIAFILRQRFEVVLKASRALKSDWELFIDNQLGELRPIFDKVSTYALHSAGETIALYRKH